MFPRMRVDDDVSVYIEGKHFSVISLNLCETRYTSQRKVQPLQLLYTQVSGKEI